MLCFTAEGGWAGLCSCYRQPDEHSWGGETAPGETLLWKCFSLAGIQGSGTQDSLSLLAAMLIQVEKSMCDHRAQLDTASPPPLHWVLAGSVLGPDSKACEHKAGIPRNASLWLPTPARFKGHKFHLTLCSVESGCPLLAKPPASLTLVWTLLKPSQAPGHLLGNL